MSARPFVRMSVRPLAFEKNHFGTHLFARPGLLFVSFSCFYYHFFSMHPSLESLQEGVLVCLSVCPSVRPLVTHWSKFLNISVPSQISKTRASIWQRLRDMYVEQFGRMHQMSEHFHFPSFFSFWASGKCQKSREMAKL